MDWYRIANFIMQAVYLPIHLYFIITLIRHKQPTPVWKYFIFIVAGLWGLIFGRFIETCLHLFWINNVAYNIAVDITLLSTTVATMSFLFWNLYIARHDKLATSREFKLVMMMASGAVCFIIASNPIHHLFYSELDLVGAKTHGSLFIPCVIIVYGMLFAGLVISIVHIIKYEDKKALRIIVFSMYPILPGVTNLIRSFSGVDNIDFNPIVMSLSILCLYQIVFKQSFVGVVAESMEGVINQTRTPIVVYNSKDSSVLYENSAAVRYHDSIIKEMIPALGAKAQTIEQSFDGRVVRAVSSETKDKDEFIATFTDVSDVVYQRRKVEEQLEKQSRLLSELDEQKRNIEAYLEALYSIPDLKEKQEMTEKVQHMISEAFTQMKQNLTIAAEGGEGAQAALAENLRIAQETITTIRKAVARLKEVS